MVPKRGGSGAATHNYLYRDVMKGTAPWRW